MRSLARSLAALLACMALCLLARGSPGESGQLRSPGVAAYDIIRGRLLQPPGPARTHSAPAAQAASSTILVHVRVAQLPKWAHANPAAFLPARAWTQSTGPNHTFRLAALPVHALLPPGVRLATSDETASIIKSHVEGTGPDAQTLAHSVLDFNYTYLVSAHGAGTSWSARRVVVLHTYLLYPIDAATRTRGAAQPKYYAVPETVLPGTEGGAPLGKPGFVSLKPVRHGAAGAGDPAAQPASGPIASLLAHIPPGARGIVSQAISILSGYRMMILMMAPMALLAFMPPTMFDPARLADTRTIASAIGTTEPVDPMALALVAQTAAFSRRSTLMHALRLHAQLHTSPRTAHTVHLPQFYHSIFAASRWFKGTPDPLLGVFALPRSPAAQGGVAAALTITEPHAEAAPTLAPIPPGLTGMVQQTLSMLSPPVKDRAAQAHTSKPQRSTHPKRRPTPHWGPAGSDKRSLRKRS